MQLIGSIILVLLVVIIVSTAFTYPKESFEYGKSIVKTIGKLYKTLRQLVSQEKAGDGHGQPDQGFRSS